MSIISNHDEIAATCKPLGSAELAAAAIALGLPTFPCDASKRPLTDRKSVV